MRKVIAGMALVVVVGVAGAIFYGTTVQEEPLAKGQLFEALVQAAEGEGQERHLTEIFAPFVADDAPLEDRIPPLLANGFRCDIRSARSGGSAFLMCLRPLEGTGYCGGFSYFSFVTASGEITDTIGAAYDARQHSNASGRCENNREAFLELPPGGGA